MLSANLDGVPTFNAPVPPVSVPASNSACVATSTLPATVSEAFGVLPVPTSTQAPHSHIKY